LEIQSPIRKPIEVFYARTKIKDDLVHTGVVVCHGTAYTPEMAMRPRTDHRQCKGATDFFRNSCPLSR